MSIKQELICPISLMIFKKPYIANDGFTYEYDMIYRLIGESSPLTREKIKVIYENKVMKKIVENYLEENPQYRDDQYKMVFDEFHFKQIVYKRDSKEIIKYLDNFSSEELNDIKINCQCLTHGMKQINILNFLLLNFYTSNLIKYLYERRIDFESEAWDGLKPIHLAIRYTKPHIVKFLIEKNVDLELVSNDGWKPIHYAFAFSTPYICKLLIKRDVNLNCNKDGFSLLTFAIKNAPEENIKILIDMGIDLESIETGGIRPIHMALFSSKINILKLLIEKGVNLESPSEKGIRCIHMALIFSTPEICKFLIEKNVDLETPTSEGSKVIHFALWKQTPEICKIIISRVNDFECISKGWKPIHYALQYSTPEICKILIRKGVNLEYAVNKDLFPEKYKPKINIHELLDLD